ncbi:MAG: sigma 54-interacting transcriptional regulator [Acidobacteriota bacterium]
MRTDDRTTVEDPLDQELEDSIAEMDQALGSGLSAAPPGSPAPGVLQSPDPTEAGWSLDATSSSGGVGVKDIIELERADHRLVYVLAALRAMVPHIKRPEDVEVFCRKMISEAGRAIDARTAAICGFDAEGQRLTSIFTFRADEGGPREHELVHALMHRAIARRTIVLTGDLEADPTLPASSESRLLHPGVTAMAAGIFDGEQPIGAIYMDRRPGAQAFEARVAGRFLKALANDASGPMTTISAWRREQRESSHRQTQLSVELQEAREQASSAMTEAEKLRRAIDEIRSRGHFQPMIGHSRAMMRVQRLMLRAGQAPKPVTVLLTGEVGTGKTFIARQIHSLDDPANSRRKGPFVDVNCAKLTGEKMEAELFGSLPHAYTGATSTQGYLRQAKGGTLFLDEVAELPLDIQAKVLKALDEGKARPIGADAQEYAVDVRIIAATNQDLDQMVAEKRFRADLLSRLRVVEIRVPPIRERKADLLELIDEKFKEIREELGKPRLKGISRLARSKMLAYEWADGNVRELEHTLRRIVVEADPEQELLHIDDLPDRIKHPAMVEGADPELLSLKEAERRWRAQFFTRALLLCEGNYSEAARRLGINTPSNLRAMVKAAGIEPTDLSSHGRSADKKDE